MPSSLLTTLILHDDLVEKDWDESQHPREPAGTSGGGRFASAGDGGGGASLSTTARANVVAHMRAIAGSAGQPKPDTALIHDVAAVHPSWAAKPAAPELPAAVPTLGAHITPAYETEGTTARANNVARAAFFQPAGRDPDKLVEAARQLAMHGVGKPSDLAAEAGLRARLGGANPTVVADVERRALLAAGRMAALRAKLSAKLRLPIGKPPVQQPQPIVGQRGDIHGAAPADKQRQYEEAVRAAGRDPTKLAEAAALGARLGLGGFKTLGRAARQQAEQAGRGLPRQRPELLRPTPERAQWKARRAVQQELGIKPVPRAPKAVMGAAAANKPPVAPAKPPGAPVKPPPETAGGAARQLSFTGTGFERPQIGLPLHPAAAAGALPAGVDESEQHLLTAAVKQDKNMGGGVNESRHLFFSDGTEGIFKPQDGARTDAMRFNITPGQDMEREAATWQVAKLVGMKDMVPTTVIRTVGGRIGSLQNWVPDSEVAAEVRKDPYDGSKDFARAAIFDAVIGNEDRHMYNWMVNQSTGKITLIDHGLTFPESTKVQSVRGFMERAKQLQSGLGYDPPPGPPIGPPSDYIKPYVDNKSQILDALTGLKLPKSAIDGVSQRIDAIAKMGRKSRWIDIGNGNYSV